MENLEETINGVSIKDINLEVFNALNLYNEDLGQSYLETGFNPFNKDFVLDEQYISDVLNNEKNKKEINCPDFLEQTDSKIIKAFELSDVNTKNLIEALDKKINSSELTASQMESFKKIIVNLKMFGELNRKYKNELRKKKNKYQLFLNMLALNWQLSEELAKSFTNEFNLNNALNKIVNIEKIKQNSENEKLKEQAKQIIENNKKLYEQDLLNKQAEQSKVVAEQPKQENTTNIDKENEVNRYQEYLKERTAEQKHEQPTRQEPTRNTYSSTDRDDGMGK
ncbi:MAG: hypothetical protein MR904_04630 [Clostridia bacterium]|nr:hypothetical protein [Clostridia bacterium]